MYICTTKVNFIVCKQIVLLSFVLVTACSKWSRDGIHPMTPAPCHVTLRCEYKNVYETVLQFSTFSEKWCKYWYAVMMFIDIKRTDDFHSNRVLMCLIS